MRLERGRRDLRVEKLLRIVFAALELRDDDGPFRFAVLRHVQAVGHPLGFDEQHPIERVARGGLEIRGLVDPGVAVPGSAELLDDAFHLVARDVGRPLEVHVLDPVRHAGQAGTFVLRADAVPAPHRDERRGAHLLDEHREPVVEHRAAERGRGGNGGVRERHVSIIEGGFRSTSGPISGENWPISLIEYVLLGWPAVCSGRCVHIIHGGAMKRLGIAAVLLAARRVGSPAMAAQSATLVLRSGERISGELVDMGAGGLTFRVNGQTRQVPIDQVAVIDFVGGRDQLQQCRAGPGRRRRCGHDERGAGEGPALRRGGQVPAEITIDLPGGGTRDYNSTDLKRIVRGAAVRAATTSRPCPRRRPPLERPRFACRGTSGGSIRG